MRKHFPSVPRAFRIDRHHDALRTEPLGGLFDKFRMPDRRGIDADLIRARLEKITDIVDRSDAAADGQGHEDLFRRATDHIQEYLALFVRGGDVEKTELISAVSVVRSRRFHGISRVFELNKAHALHDAASLYVQAWNNSFRKHHYSY